MRHRRPVSRARSVRTLTVVLAAGLSVHGAGWATPLVAQSTSRSSVADIERRVDLVEPTSGPPGTRVRVASGEMPSITPIRVGLGGMRSGFESLLDVLTTMDGEFDVTVALPQWASWDRVHRFVVFDIYFAPIALSELFHVTNAEGLVRREGTVHRGPGGCLFLKDLDGISYALRGGPPEVVRVGADVAVEARIADGGTCGLDYTLDVESATAR